MTRLHKIYFYFFKKWCMLNSIYIGRIIYTYSNYKKKDIKGVVYCFCGDSITNKKFGFDIGVVWLEPIQGNDYNYYSHGFYKLKSFREKKLF